MFGRPQLVILLLLLVAGLVWLRQPSNDQQVRTALIMGTLVEIKASGESELLDPAIDAAFAEMTRIEDLFSTHRQGSEISQLSAATGSVKVSVETAELLKQGQQIARQSDGAFDLTLGGLKQLWGMETDSPQVPTTELLQQALQGTGPEALQFDGQQVSKAKPGLQVDLGGIAKGYAVDRAVAILRQAGILSAAVNAGGDIGLLGARGDANPWRIGIQHPRNSGKLLTTLILSDRAVVTSGDYERFFERDGIRYHHIFDPRTGYPAGDCQSVTVVALDVATADALTTAAFVLGPQLGLKLLEEVPQVEGLLVAIDGTLYRTSGFSELEL